MLTHTSPTGAYRGAGRPEAIYLIERLMDAAARKLGMDPAELRRRNMIRPEQMPYKNPMDKTYDSGNFASVMDQALALADWTGFETRRAEAGRRMKLRGRGMAAFLEWTGADVFEEQVTVTVAADGYVEIFSATQAMGQGLATTYAQLAVDVFDVPIEKIGSCKATPTAGRDSGSAGSRSLFVGGFGSAGRGAAHGAKGAGSRRGGTRGRGDGHRVRRRSVHRRRNRSPDRPLRARATAAAAADPARLGELGRRADVAERLPHLRSRGRPRNGPGAGRRLRVGERRRSRGESADRDRPTGRRGGARHRTGAVRKLRLRRRVRPGAHWQLHGLRVPRATIVADFRTTMDESTPCLNNAMGVKGVGELGTIGATPAVVNAVLDALARAGAGSEVNALQSRLTSERVWRVLRDRAG